MPIYEYKCESCGAESEVLQKMSDPAPEVCDHCGNGPLRKLLSQTAFVLKGTGWYETDFKGKPKKPDKSTSETSSSESVAKSETKSESKSDSSAPAKTSGKSESAPSS